ncbi:MAG: peptidoglycan DD-metalloendopeptidase family protein [Spirosomataceae bacterium]
MKVVDRISFLLVVIIALLLGSNVTLYAQKSRQQLEKEKQDNLDRLKQLQGILKQTSEQKRASLGQLKAIKQQISAQNRKIELINDDLELMNSELTELQKAKVELDVDLEKLREEYGKMIYNSAKRNNSLSELTFLFSAPTFNQLLIRYKYLKQYTDERKKQVEQMKKVQSLMIAKSQSISNKKKDQENALQTRIAESKNLEQLKGEKDKVVKELSGREKEISAEVAEVRRANKQLENALTRIIQREIEERRERARLAAREKAAKEKAAREAAAKAAEKNNTEIIAEKKPDIKEETNKEELNAEGMNEEEVSLASSFAASRGRLPWPVPGFISDGFGTKEVLKNVYQENQGVDIQTSAGSSVKTVYDGVVMDVTNMGVMKNVVFVQHGDFYTVYAKLKNVNVRPGQKLKARDTIGVVATDTDGVSEVNFQIWKNTSKLNPEPWLRPK